GGTIKAVEAFQRDYGLSVDGAAGEKTQAVLFSSQCDPSPIPQITPSPSPAPSPTPTAETSPMPSASPSPTVFVPLPGSVG
ncbi:MAG: peptidoglycan-binding protein, partial [Clostridia bacterium]|nr:peptidoglycan-binding protein [Clostridia bacterium]